MLEGIIVKGIGGFYYVKTDQEVVQCRARGLFRDENITPLIGDKVKIRISSEDNNGYIEEILPRTSQLLRPAVANITQAIIVMSIKKPNINTWLLDKFIVMAEHEGLNIVICLNKSDLDKKEINNLMETYKKAGYKVIITSSKENLGIEELRDSLSNNISVFAGPSGVGKSSLLNRINDKFQLETGSISNKSERGKHTTRHVELLELGENTFVLDTPGFSSLALDFVEDEADLRQYFREIHEKGKGCRFQSCLHDKEPNCAVKDAVKDNLISQDRYNNYLLLLEEIQKIRRY